VSDEMNLELKINIKLKKMPKAEYEAIMIPYKRLMLQFEKNLRQLADNGVISFSIVDEFTKKFNFGELQRLRFSTPEDQDLSLQGRTSQPAPIMQAPQYQAPQQTPPQASFAFNQPQQNPATARNVAFGQQQQPPATSTFGQQNLTSQRPSSFTFGQSQQPSPAPTSNFGFGKSENPSFGGSGSSPRPGTAPPQSSFGRQESQNTFGNTGGNLGSFSDLSNEPATKNPSFSPRSPPPSQPSFGLSNDFGGQSKPQEGKISIGVDEEDRATGIAILRKKMLMELRKIRNVVEQEDDSSF
jgi:hypothetical protein